MFGNKFATDELIRNFQQNISKFQSAKKKASGNKEESSSDSGSVLKTAQVKPEDFLVAPAKEDSPQENVLDGKIEEVSSYAEDTSCEECSEGHLEEVECGSLKESDLPDLVVMPMMADDVSYLVDRKAQYILHELGKIEGEMRAGDKNFAADMILSTANNIKNNALKKAAEKLKVVSSLEKMAKDAYSNDDKITGDVVTITIQNIKSQQ